MKKFSIFLAFVALLVVSTSSALAQIELADWQYQRTINTGDVAGYLRLPLDHLVSRTSANWTDVRIINDNNQEVPYQIVSGDSIASAQKLDATLLNLSTDRAGNTSFVLDMGMAGSIHNAVQIVTSNPNFRRQVRVAASNTIASAESTTWKSVNNNGYIFKFTDPKTRMSTDQLMVTYPDNTSRYILVTITAGEEGPLDINNASVRSISQGGRVSDIIQRDATITNNSKTHTTVLQFDLGEKGYISRGVTLLTDEVNFDRHTLIEASDEGNSWYLLGRGHVSSIKTDIFEGRSLTLRYPEAKARFIRLVVYNADNQPITWKAEGVFELAKTWAVFDADRGRTYKLYYGNAQTRAPRYDISRIINYIQVGALPETTLGRETVNPDYIPHEPSPVAFSESHEWFLNSLLGVAVLVLGFGIFSYLKSYFVMHSSDKGGFKKK